MGSTESSHTTDRRFGTLAVHAGAHHDPVTGAVIAPVSPAIEKTRGEGYTLTSDRSLCPPPMLRPALETPLACTSTLAAPTPTGESYSAISPHLENKSR
jgi:hypothetical protein